MAVAAIQVGFYIRNTGVCVQCVVEYGEISACDAVKNKNIFGMFANLVLTVTDKEIMSDSNGGRHVRFPLERQNVT